MTKSSPAVKRAQKLGAVENLISASLMSGMHLFCQLTNYHLYNSLLAGVFVVSAKIFQSILAFAVVSLRSSHLKQQPHVLSCLDPLRTLPNDQTITFWPKSSIQPACINFLHQLFFSVVHKTYSYGLG